MEIYVFGAGASEPYGAPTMGEFLSRAFSGWMFTPPDGTHFEQDLRTVAQAIDDYYGTDLLAAQQGGEHFAAETAVALSKINLEELLALADEEDKTDVRQALESVIFNTIERSIQGGNECNCYERLMTQLVRSEKKACLISFNYDLLLDRALTDAAHGATSTWSYGVPFHAGIVKFPSYPDIPDPTIFLLKLHGSLNWARCRNCNSLRLYAYKTYENISRATWPACTKCSGVSTGFEPVLVAPTAVKQFPDGLDSAWETAATCLRETEKLTVIGYSFPAFDRRSRVLFLKNLVIPHLFVDSRPKLAIVDRDHCTRKAIKSWFLPAVDRNVEEYDSFDDYCKMLQ